MTICSFESSANYFSLLIRKAIGKNPEFPEITSGDWLAIFELAKKQAVVGICFSAVGKLYSEGSSVVGSLPSELKLKWLALTSGIQLRNEVVNQRCVKLQKFFTREGFDTYVMKGQGNAVLYGDELGLLRQSGDIDVFLDGGYKRVMEFVERTHPTKSVNELEIHYDCFDDVQVEVHYHPFIMRNPLKNAKLQKFFEEESNNCFCNYIQLPNGVGEISVPTPVFNVVHQLVHIYHHLFTEGIGIRQLMDYYFVLEDVNRRSLDVSKSVKVINDLGLERFAHALMWCLEEVFDAKENILLWTPEKTDGAVLLRGMLRSGNFGQADGINIKLKNKLMSFWYVNSKAFCFARFDHWAWFWSPLWRVYHFAWRKIHGYD